MRTCETQCEEVVVLYEASTVVWEGVSILTESGEWVDRGPLVGDIGGGGKGLLCC